MWWHAKAVLDAARGLSITTVACLAVTSILAFVLRRKGYGVRFAFATIVLTAQKGSRRFPDGVEIRISTRFFAFLFGGCRGPWLDVSSDRFVMRLRASSRQNSSSGSSLKRRFERVSAALSVDNGYWRVVMHNIVVQLVVFLLRGIRVRAQRVHIWKHGAHWALKANQLVYSGSANGMFGSRYDLSVNELYILAYRYANGCTPPQGFVDETPFMKATAFATGAHPAFAPTARTGNARATSFGLASSNEQKSNDATGDPNALLATVVLKHGVHFGVVLKPRVLTLFGFRRMAILDGVKIFLDARDLSMRFGHVVTAYMEKAAVSLCPGYNREARARLPPSTPSARRTRKPGILRYWDCTGTITGVYGRLVPPSTEKENATGAHGTAFGAVGTDTNERGLFAHLQSMTFDYFGRAADEKQQAMAIASAEFREFYAGSIAVEDSARHHCEVLTSSPESCEDEPSGKEAAENPSETAHGPKETERIVTDPPSSSGFGRRKSEVLSRLSRFAEKHSRRSPGGLAGRFRRKSSDSVGDYRSMLGVPSANSNASPGAAEKDDDVNEHRENAQQPDPIPEGFSEAPRWCRRARQSMEHIVEMRPAALLWIASAKVTHDKHCAVRKAVRLDFAGNGSVAVLEPLGMGEILQSTKAFAKRYRKPPRQEPGGSLGLGANGHTVEARRVHSNLGEGHTDATITAGAARLSRTPSLPARVSSDLASHDADHTKSESAPIDKTQGRGVIALDMKKMFAVILSAKPTGDTDTMSVIFGLGALVVPRFIRDGHPNGGPIVDAELKNVRVDHWTLWDKSTQVYCSDMAFTNTADHTGANKLVTTNGLYVDWNLDLQTALDDLRDRLRQMTKPKVEHSTKSAKGLELTRDADARAASRSDVTVSRNGAHGVPHHSPVLGAGVDDGTKATPGEAGKGASAELPSDIVRADDAAHAHNEQADRDGELKAKFLKTLNSWSLAGSNVAISASFPDGPRMGFTAEKVPEFCLEDPWYCLEHVVLILADTKLAYAGEFRIENPILCMGKYAESRRVNVVIERLRAVMRHDFWFGPLLSDWMTRMKAALNIVREARYLRKNLPPPKPTKKPFPDLLLHFSDFGLYFEDHVIGSFLTRSLPVMQDEALEREKRYAALLDALYSMRQVGPIGDKADRLLAGLREQDFAIHKRRMMALKESAGVHHVAEGYIPPLNGVAMALVTADALDFALTMDDATRAGGYEESIRRLKTYDVYLLGPQKQQKTRQYDTDVWNGIGFRDCDLDATNLCLQFRDFPKPFVSIDRLCLKKGAVVGQTVQAATAPYLARTSVALGRRRAVDIVRSLGPTKTYFDCHLIANVLHCTYNPSYMSSIGDFARACGRFSAGGKNPSPRIPWFDTLRASLHGKFCITARTLKGPISSSISPYTLTRHYVNVEANNVTMHCSRFAATSDEPYPISWTLHNWRLRPSWFKPNMQSLLALEYTKVSLNPVPQTLSGDPQDHYFIPMPTKEEILRGGPGIGRAREVLRVTDAPFRARVNALGNYTTWTTPDLPADFNSYKDFRTDDMYLGIHIDVRQAPGVARPTMRLSDMDDDGMDAVDTDSASDADSQSASNLQSIYDSDPFWAPDGASLLHSDGITTLIRSIGKVIRRPIQNRMAPRWIDSARKPPCREGLSYCLMSLDLNANIQDLNFMVYNNLEHGDGLFLSAKKMEYAMSKVWTRRRDETDPSRYIKQSRKTREHAAIEDVYAALRKPGLEFVDSRNGCGFMFSLASLRLITDPVEDDEQDSKLQTAPDDDFSFSPVHDSDRRDTSSSFTTTTRQPSSGFGDDRRTSPFYTFSSKHALHRGKKLDMVVYRQSLVINGVRILWSPIRRDSAVTWPDAFKEKRFVMDGPKVRKTDFELLDDLQKARKNGGSESGATTPTEASEAPSIDTIAEDSAGASGERDNSTDKDYQDGGLLDLLEKPKRRYGSASSHGSGDKDSNYGLSFEAPSLSDEGGERQENGRTSRDDGNRGVATSVTKVMDTDARFQLLITDSQVCFGSPETNGLVFLTSESASVGFIDKTIQETHQLGKDIEEWVDKEHRVHLQETRVYCRPGDTSDFDFHGVWIPTEKPSTIERQLATSGSYDATRLAQVTLQPVSMNVMFIRSWSKKDAASDDTVHSFKPSLLFINVPDISMDSTSSAFHSVMDVVRKVLMKRMPNANLVKDELGELRYSLQLAGGSLSTYDLEDYQRRLNNITKQIMYAMDTFQPQLVAPLIREEHGDISANLARYKAKAKAVATYTRSEHRAKGAAQLFPTMYISYSFDQCSWKLRNLDDDDTPERAPFVELTLDDLVCRHVFFVGKGSSAEFTFRNINATNHQESGVSRGILHPSGSPTSTSSGLISSRIKASDGTPVTFRWSATQLESVGGIPVYDMLTINVAPLNAAITNSVYEAVLKFAFGTRKLKEALSAGRAGSSKDRAANAGSSSTTASTSKRTAAGSSGGSSSSAVHSAGASQAIHNRSRSQDVEEMNVRGQSSMLFRYVYIGEFQLTASYRKRDQEDAPSMLDISDLTVDSPSYMYSSEVWSWRDFARQIKKELLVSFAVRGVTNMAKIKLLPGYQRVHYQRVQRHIKQGTDRVRNRIERATGREGEYEGEDSESAASSDDDDEADAAERPAGAPRRSLEDPSYAVDRRRRDVLVELFGQRAGRAVASSSTSDLGSHAAPLGPQSAAELGSVQVSTRSRGSRLLGRRSSMAEPEPAPEPRETGERDRGAPTNAKPPRASVFRRLRRE